MWPGPRWKAFSNRGLRGCGGVRASCCAKSDAAYLQRSLAITGQAVPSCLCAVCKHAITRVASLHACGRSRWVHCDALEHDETDSFAASAGSPGPGAQQSNPTNACMVF